jgi:hypothetical protein
MNYKKLGTIPLADMLKQLQEKAPDLYAEVVSVRSRNHGRLSQLLAQKLDNWLVAQVPPYRDTFKDETRELVEREGKRIRDEREAAARIEHWRSQGLLDNEHNANAITKFIKEHSVLKGRFTSQAVDVAVDFLGPKGSNVLQWRSIVVAPAPAATPKPWKPGDQLPLDATVQMLRDAPVGDVKEWKRRKQGK